MSLSSSANPVMQYALPAGGTLAAGRSVGNRTGAGLDWLEQALRNMLARHRQNLSGWETLARRLFSFTELDELVAKIETGAHSDRLAALAGALDIRFSFNNLENLETVGDRPVILFGNHPTGGGNVLGMSLLLANRFPDHRILGNRHFKLMPSLSEMMIPVDPFCSTSAMNLEALVKLRREFGTQYKALGVFPAGISSKLKMSGTISDRRWSDAFIRIARHHDALLVPIWFSGRNRLRYYIAALIRKELGFLALPAEFLRLRGKTITVNIGKPISPDALRAIPDRRAQMSFLRAGVYELGGERAVPPVRGNESLARPCKIGRTIEPPCGNDPIPVGKNLVARVVDSASAVRIEEIAGTFPVDGFNGATHHVIVTPRDRLVPCVHWQVLDWRQFSTDELDRLSPLRRAFRLPGDVAGRNRNWLEIVSFGAGKELGHFAAMRRTMMALRQVCALSKTVTDVVGLVTLRETNFALASLQFAILQKTLGDSELLRAGANAAVIGSVQHHDWRPRRDVGGVGRPARRDQMHVVDPLLRHLAGIGVRFGAEGLCTGPAPRPCILGRLDLTAKRFEARSVR
jgi:putative hemolysin